MGLTNVQVMVPFVRTLTEARQVTELLSANGLTRGEKGLKLIMMCELPTNAVLADRYLEFFDGMSIGSNDMTQLTLGSIGIRPWSPSCSMSAMMRSRPC